MAFYDKYIPKELKKGADELLDFGSSVIEKGITKPFASISDKLIPNELRFLAPYAAGIGTLMLPPGMGSLYRGLSGAGLNILGQIGADETPVEDISDLNALSIALAGGLGALGATPEGTAQGAAGATTPDGRSLREVMTSNEAYRGGVPKPEMLSPSGSIPFEQGISFKAPSTDVGFFEGIGNVSKKGLEMAQDYVQGNRDTLAGFGADPSGLASLSGLKSAAGALGPTLSQGTGDVAYEAAVDMKNAQDALDAEEAAEIEATTTANESERAGLQMTMMRQAGIPEETVEETLAMNDLSEYYVPPASAAEGGIIGLKEGGMLNFGGREMDLRTGGFVPIGKKERADDVPARLSKNEFVMTADAVRAAGGGSVNKGAQRMYDVMNKLEARA